MLELFALVLDSLPARVLFLIHLPNLLLSCFELAFAFDGLLEGAAFGLLLALVLELLDNLMHRHLCAVPRLQLYSLQRAYALELALERNVDTVL